MWETAFNSVQTRAAEVWQLLGTWLSAHLLQIIIIIVSAEIIYRVSTKTLTKIVERATHRPDLFPTELDRKKRIKTLNSLVNATLRIFIFVIAGIMIISELGINTGPLIASAGIIGVALGFGAQSLIKDFMSGFFIITENQYRVGDVVEVVTNNGAVRVSGVVEAITIRTTVIRDMEGRLHHIPNGNVQVATNMTMNYAGIDEELVVDLNTDIDKLEHIINHVGEQLAANHALSKKILDAPHFGRVDRLDKDGLVIKIFAKTTPGDQWLIKGEMYKKLNTALDKNDIVMARQEIIIHESRKK